MSENMKLQPNISDYIDAMRSPAGRFRTLGTPAARVDAHGEIVFAAGGNAAIFRLADGSALKCYTKPPRHAHTIYKYRDSLLPRCRLLPDEIFVHDMTGAGGWHDVAVCEWIEGSTLDAAMRYASREGGFAQLSSGFEHLATALLAREWAHGDLKPENIIVQDDGTMRLVDIDAMWLPELAGISSGEVGTPNYQHPARDENYFCKFIDDFPAALIAVNLRALALDPALWARRHVDSNLIIATDDVLFCKQAYNDVMRLFASHGHYHSLRLARALHSPTPLIEGLMEMLLSSPQQTVFAGDVFDNDPVFGGGATVVCAMGSWKIVGEDGSMTASLDDWDFVKPLREGVAAARRGSQWGYIAADGTVPAAPRFDMAASMHESRAVVCRDGRYGYVDALGEVVIPLEWDYALSFRNGRAAVERNGVEYTIDRDGAIVNG